MSEASELLDGIRAEVGPACSLVTPLIAAVEAAFATAEPCSHMRRLIALGMLTAYVEHVVASESEAVVRGSYAFALVASQAATAVGLTHGRKVTADGSGGR